MILTATVLLFLLRCERLEGRVLRCKPTLVTLRIDPSLAAFLGQHATDLLDPDDKIYPVVKRSTILDAAVSSQTKSNPNEAPPQTDEAC